MIQRTVHILDDHATSLVFSIVCSAIDSHVRLRQQPELLS